MALFGGEKQKPAALPAAPRGAPAGPPGLSIIGAGMSIQGDVDTGGVVKIEGVVVGHVVAAHQVLVAKGGRIDGDIVTGEAMIAGVVHGSVQAQQRVEIQTGAVVEGDITTRRILVAEGAQLNGTVRMSEDRTGAAASGPSDSPARSDPVADAPGGGPGS